MPVKKPEHRWQTRRHRAVRRVDATAPHEARSEVLQLQFDDGREATAELSLAQQRVPAWALAADPDLEHAVMCWLAARGGDAIALVDDTGMLRRSGAFTLDALGDAVVGATRVITLAPSNAELVAALHAFGRVIACEDSSDDPPDVARCERLGPDLDPDLDRVAALRPELVVSSLTVPGMERIVTGLRARGVAQLVSAPRSVAAVADDLRRLGHALAVDPSPALARFTAERDALARSRPATPRRVYLEWWPRPMFTPGRACFSNELIALAGGVNVFGDREGQSLEIDAAALRAADPDACFVSWCGVAADKLDPDNLVRREGLGQLRAVQRGQVFALDERYAGRPGPNMLEAARRMRARLWPELP